MKTKLIGAFIAFVLGSAVVLQAAEPGTTCYSAIPLGKEYTANITGPQSVWYTAWTFDLPLAVYFIPENESDPAPEVAMDFGCTPQVYSDPIICMLFCKGGTITMPMPHKPPLETTTIEGKKAYYISMGKTYRDLLLKMGIDYNVEVFVNVTYHGAGFMSMAPDNMFSNCMDGAKFLHLGDEVKVKSEDRENYRIAPYVQWMSDSIRYIWNGEKKCILAVATKCDFDPEDNSIDEMVQFKRMEPGETLRMTSADIARYVNSDEKPSEAGMFFVKFFSKSSGVMKVEQIPMLPPDGNATLLQYDKVVDIPNDTNALFAFPQSWDVATKFTTPTDHVFKMYVGTTADFYIKDAIASYQFYAFEGRHWLGILKEEMMDLWKQTKAKYLYVRFECTTHTTLLPSKWDPTECTTKWELIPKGENSFVVTKGSNGKVYRRFYYNDWRGGDMTFVWKLTTNACPAYIGNTCSFEPDENDEHVIASYLIPKNEGVWTISADEIESWANRVEDPDGCLFLLCNPSKQGEMMITTTAPDETDPVYPHTTIQVVCADESGKNITVSVSEAQHVTLSGDGGVVEEWDAVPGETKTLSLESGSYVLQGENEQLNILVP